SEMHMHGLQIWIALPKHLEQMNPEFFHIAENEIPAWQQDGISFKLIAGEAFGRKSGVPVYSKLYMVEIKSKATQHISLGEYLYGESGLYILEGGVESDGNVYGPKQMLVTKDSHLCNFTIQANSTVYIFGGEPFPEERFIDWNFVASSKELIEEAKRKWREQTFDKIKGDETEYIPYPTLSKK
ncbi:MAG TPA: pirin-like C-terminal cupin domain-containing protein, partial [Cyclobacteriaceae bacterium]|nr:pirin-like C-terminal cupin domain-containing protein [Cyclobacteriaceae bacterium]